VVESSLSDEDGVVAEGRWAGLHEGAGPICREEGMRSLFVKMSNFINIFCKL